MKPLSELNPAITYSFNIINLLKLRDHLVWMQNLKSFPKVGFNMAVYRRFSDLKYLDMSEHKCGTVACIAGHAVILSKEPILPDLCKSLYDDVNYFHKAMAWLELTADEAQYLFSGSFANGTSMSKIPLDRAIEELNYMVEHGHTSRTQKIPYFEIEVAIS